ncbi:MAG: C40 family peptidase [Clostridia bacterium]|nr:C40 family peptidase [Clostridia bacterium]
MLKRIFALILPLFAFAEGGETESFYAYFKDARWLRAEPGAGTATVENVPERTLLRLTPVDEKYAATTYKGKTGYIYYKDYVAVDYTDPHSENAVTVEGFFGAPVYMRRSPLRNAALVAELPTDARFQITFVTDEYAYILYEGEEGYVFIADFVQMTYQHGELEPYVAFATEDTPAYETPYYGATVAATIPPYTPVLVDGYDGDHLTLEFDGKPVYVEQGELMRLNDDFAVDAFQATIAKDAEAKEYPLENAETVYTFKKNAEVTVDAFHGEYARVSDGEQTGYIHYSQLKSSKATEQALEALQKQVERIEAQRYLNIAFTMLEEGNPILEAFNNRCGGAAIARFKYGCPYLWAGMNESSLLRARHPSSNSNYYFTENLYLGGFDCIGFARWVHNKAGMKKLPAISDSISSPKSNLVSVKGLDYNEWYTVLKVGDCVNLAYKGSGYHIVMYIGTLRDFGYTEDMLGDLAPYIDHPLVIHCGMNNFHTAWYTEYFKEVGYTSVTPPDGGVTISILGIPFADAPFTETMWSGTKNKKTFYWFDLEGYNLTVINPADENSYRWFCVYRNTEM